MWRPGSSCIHRFHQWSLDPVVAHFHLSIQDVFPGTFNPQQRNHNCSSYVITQEGKDWGATAACFPGKQIVEIYHFTCFLVFARWEVEDKTINISRRSDWLTMKGLILLQLCLLVKDAPDKIHCSSNISIYRWERHFYFYSVRRPQPLHPADKCPQNTSGTNTLYDQIHSNYTALLKFQVCFSSGFSSSQPPSHAKQVSQVYTSLMVSFWCPLITKWLPLHPTVTHHLVSPQHSHPLGMKAGGGSQVNKLLGFNLLIK